MKFIVHGFHYIFTIGDIDCKMRTMNSIENAWLNGDKMVHNYKQ